MASACAYRVSSSDAAPCDHAACMQAAAGEGATDGAGKTQAAVEAAVQAAVETMNSVMSNPPEGFSKVQPFS